jgi:type IV secretory pathway protease TraF
MISRLIFSLVALFTLSVMIGRLAHFRIIATDSVAPAGIYRTGTAPVIHGELVLACLPFKSAVA